jgi:hypothetical protein
MPPACPARTLFQSPTRFNFVEHLEMPMSLKAVLPALRHRLFSGLHGSPFRLPIGTGILHWHQLN